MKTFLTEKRRSGLLAHVSSLPSPYGIGDIGPSSWDFLDFLSDSGQTCWQFLPLNPTNCLFDNSPYMSTAALAGSPLLISPDLLLRDGLISRISLEDHPIFSPYFTEYEKVEAYKKRILLDAFKNFKPENDSGFKNFCNQHKWLEDYSLFMSLKSFYGDIGWFDWPENAALRTPATLAELQEQHIRSILYFKFEQFIFYNQWKELRQKARKNEILLFGDIPIYVGLDSVDVWAHQEIFTLDHETKMPTEVSGVPPDYFSDTGQKWGNPLYRWNTKSHVIQEKLSDWWTQRFKAQYELVDIARIDHFRGFESYWAIPAENDDATKGNWIKGPGAQFFKKMFDRLGPLNIIAEDLGIISEEVHNLRDELGFPGMKVLQFGFDGDPGNDFLPHNYTTPNCVVYTGTHDNDTTVGWFLSDKLDDPLRDTVKKMANREMHDHSPIHHDFIYLALSSTAALAIIPLQDVLGFGSDCRINTPGKPDGNWRWRCAPEYLSAENASLLKHLSKRFHRF